MINELTNSKAVAQTAPTRTLDARMVRKGLLWQQWLAHGTLLRAFLTAWVIGVWIIPVCIHPGVVLAFGFVYGCVAGTIFGGSDVIEGTEEFTLALPPRRQERYIARLSVGLAPLLGFIILAFVCSYFFLPQELWGLIFESGFTEPFYGEVPPYAYFLALLVPLAAYSFSFVIAALIPARSVMSAAWLGGGLSTFAIVWVGEEIEKAFWDELNWWPVCLCLSVSVCVVLRLGHYLYSRKEGVSRPSVMGG